MESLGARMKNLQVQVRSYGWYCPSCEQHLDIGKTAVVRVISSKVMTVICRKCKHELTDCFLNRGNCPECPDRFMCATQSGTTVGKQLILVHSQEIYTIRQPVKTDKIRGVRTYTGIYNDKLETENYCAHPNRDDCNHSWMRSFYDGQPYSRCEHMIFDMDSKKWVCLHAIKMRNP
jgi:uncharacterized CHY-type Zn-finger protein